MSQHPSSHHHHHHHHPHDPSGGDAGREPSVKEKLATILVHWITHNESHAQAYREWALKASELSMPAVRARIEEAVELTLAANRKFEEALREVRERG